MKRLLTFITSLIILSAAMLPTFSLAAGNYGLDVTAGKANYITGNAQNDTVEGIFSKVVNAFLTTMALFFFFLMLYGGIRWMTARGQEEYIEKAKKIIEAGVIGLVIIMGSYAIANFVLGRLQ